MMPTQWIWRGRLRNDSYWRFIILHPEFQQIRDADAPKIPSDLDCFLRLLSERLTGRAVKILQKAQERYKRYEPLVKKLRDKAASQPGPMVPAKVEAQRIKAIVDFEVASNKKDLGWNFKDSGGLTRVVEDFFVMAEYLENQQSDRLQHWCLTVGKTSLNKADRDTLEQIPDEKQRNTQLIQKVQPIVEPVWMFFIALCHALQEDDNELTAHDAYWFGLVDEVWGSTSLITSRWFEEYEEDKEESHSDSQENKSDAEPEKHESAGA